MNCDSYSIHDTTISFINETDRGQKKDWLKHKFRHYGYFYQIMNMLAAEGFNVQQDPDVDKIIRRDYWIGKRGDLEFDAQKYPNGFKVQFFQNVVYENQSGGRYDFDKLEKMPYLIRLQYKKYMNKIIELLKTLVVVDDKTSRRPKLAEDKIKYYYAESCHHEPKDTNFDLRSLDGLTQPTYNGLDRDKKELHNGDMKYFRNISGYLSRGVVYHNLNNMWYVITDKYTVRNVAAHELFDLAPDDFRGRKVKAKIPKEYQERRDAISRTKTKELIAELRNRGLKVSAC